MPDLTIKEIFWKLNNHFYIIKQWKSRKLITDEKVIVLKILILPKINHLILTLQTLTMYFIKSLIKY